MRRMALRPRTVAAACALGLILAGTACSDDEPAPTATDQSEVPASGDRADLSTYDSVSTMAEALTAAGMPCALEYEGLRDAGKELSLCTLEGEQATLSIWFEPEQLDEFLVADLGASGAVAVGGNWTVDVSTDALAGRVADALGGIVKA
jgi:hypothetical protein